MREIFVLLGVVCWFVSVVILVFVDTNSAFHEIEAILLFLCGCVLFGFSAVISRISDVVYGIGQMRREETEETPKDKPGKDQAD